MDRNLVTRLVLILIVIGACGYLLLPTYQYFSNFQGMTPDQVANLPEAQRRTHMSALDKSLKLGLDLQGGMHLVAELDESQGKIDNKGDALDRVMEILSTRVDKFGVTEPTIARQGDNRILIQLPGVEDPSRVRDLIGTTAELKFRMVVDQDQVIDLVQKVDAALAATQKAEAPADTAATAGSDSFPFGQPETKTDANPLTKQFVAFQNGAFFVPDDGIRVQTVQQLLARPETRAVLPATMEFVWSDEDGPQTADGLATRPLYLLKKQAELSGATLEDARVSPDPDRPGRMMIEFRLNRRGARQFARVTGENVGKQLAIVLDDVVKSAPNIQNRIPNGQAQITGSYTDKQASDLAIVLRAGALPVTVKFIEERTVGPTLGSDSLQRGLTAGLFGLGLSVLFLLVYYRLSGLVAAVALTLNMLIVLAAMAVLGAALSLPGIAGLVLSVAMAVDANVLIFERIREELRKAKTVGASIEAGYKNAFSAILDSNLTTVFAGIVLLYFGTGPIKGFAVTLIIGITASMFTALFVTRFIFDAYTRRRRLEKLSI